MTDPRYLTVGDVAERWHRSELTIRRRLKDGELEGFREGRQWLVPIRAVEAYEKAHSNVAVKTGRGAR